MPGIKKLEHRCMIRSGSMQGNTHVQEVDCWDVRFGNKCDHCGEELADSDAVLLHIYEELTNQEDLSECDF